MAAPKLLITDDATLLAELTARTAISGGVVAWKLEIDPDGLGYDDYTSYLDNNQLQISARAGIFQAAESSQAQWVFKNKGTFVEGDLANCKVKISFKIGAAAYFQCFQGYVDQEGCQRAKASLVQDVITVSAHDFLKSRGVNKKCASEAIVGFKICDTSDTANSIMHRLATRLGLTGADLDFMSVALTKDYYPTKIDDTVLRKMQDITRQHGAFLGVRFDGKLRFYVWTAAEWVDASSEYVLGVDKVHSWTAKGTGVKCNRARTEFHQYDVLSPGLIYKNYDQWDQVNNRNKIIIQPGRYWPGGDDGTDDKAVARLQYARDGEQFPIGIRIVTPTLAATGGGADIESSDGLPTIVSFNGSTSDTSQNLDSSEIILKNNNAVAITLTAITVRGTPVRDKSVNKVEYVDPGLTDDALEVLTTIDGLAATSVDQAKATVKREVDYGHVSRKSYEAICDFTPHAQCGALVTFAPDDAVNVVCQVVGYKHTSSGPHTGTRTTFELVERVDKSDTGAGVNTAITNPPAQSQVPTPTFPQVIDCGSPSTTTWDAEYDCGAPDTVGATLLECGFPDPDAIDPGTIHGGGSRISDVTLIGQTSGGGSYSIGKGTSPLLVKDPSGVVVHDTPDANVPIGSYPMGHLFMHKLDIDAYTLYDSTAAFPVTWSTLTAVRDAFGSRVKGVRVKWYISCTGTAATGPLVQLVLRPKGSVFSSSHQDLTVEEYMGMGFSSAVATQIFMTRVMDVAVDSNGQFEWWIALAQPSNTSRRTTIMQLGVWI